MVTYYRLELQRHDVVLANGLMAETCLAGADSGVCARLGGPAQGQTAWPGCASGGGSLA